MRKITFILFFMCSFCYCQNSKSGRITYQIASIDSGNKVKIDKKFSDIQNDFNKLLLIRDKLIFNLDFKNGESLYYFDNSLDLGLSIEPGYRTVLMSFANSAYYKNDAENLVLQRLVNDAVYILESKLDKIKWELSSTSKIISGYTCYKATTKIISRNSLREDELKTVEAWYSPEIPVNSGPKDYAGLPGLILELKHGKLKYYATSMNFKLNEKENKSSKKPKRGQKMLMEEYYNIRPNLTKEEFKSNIEKR